MSIQHREEMPRPGVVYRCHICRLELIVNGATGKLDVPPVSRADENDAFTRKKPARRKSS
ncbi:MAG TPA: hypothetical protein VH702_20440 [Vicinamibacterales bacterium]|jgi:hypothetical protein